MKTLILISAALAGCASWPTLEQERQTVSSGFIGCPVAEIKISEGTSYTWTAACKEKVFYCTVAPSASCKEAIK